MQKISNSELEIMKVLWKKNETTSLEIIDELKERVNWNKNTVRTLITRLLNKGIIQIIAQQGKTHVYKSLVTEKDYKKKITKSFLEKIYNGSVNNMLLNFIKQEKISKEDLQKLIDLIESEENK